ncbi:MAG: hypothetical protein M3P33_03650, partial [bacterium]|nr:hypothetical protein [bacterium]
MNTRKHAITFLLISLFVLFSWSVSLNFYKRFDLNTIQLLQSIVPTSFDMMLSYLSVFGNVEVTAIVLIILFYKKINYLSFIV